jgi:hypothetical protein
MRALPTQPITLASQFRSQLSSEFSRMLVAGWLATGTTEEDGRETKRAAKVLSSDAVAKTFPRFLRKQQI